MASDLDRTGWDGVGAPESHGHSLDGAPGPREPGRGLSRVPTDDEFVHSVVSQDEMTQGAGSTYTDAYLEGYQKPAGYDRKGAAEEGSRLMAITDMVLRVQELRRPSVWRPHDDVGKGSRLLGAASRGSAPDFF